MHEDDQPQPTRPTVEEPTAPVIRASRSPELAAPGKLIDGTYRVVGTLGEGGMGIVLRAHDERLQRDVAIKLVRPELLADSAHRARFLSEARAMARVRHPNVVEIHAFGELAGSPYFVMELVPGNDLESFLAARGAPLSMGEAHSILVQICRGVEAIHASGTAHRDIKSSNVLLGEGFRVAITDLGLASSIDPSCSDAGAGGTPAYMAPEVVLGEALAPEELATADVYSLGVIAYEVVTGRLPFAAKEVPAVLFGHLSCPPRPPSELRPELPPAYERAILDALTKDRALRTPSATALRHALEAAWSESRGASGPLRFLVADDDDGFRSLLAATLAKAFPSAVIETVGDGDSALAAAQAYSPSLVVSDLDMPGLNGIELTAALRAHPDTARTPIVVATAVGGATDWRILSELGADGFLVKPFDAAHFVGLLENLLAREASWRPTKRPAA